MPEVSSKALRQKLSSAKSGKLDLLWFVTGNEPLLALEAEDMIRAAAKEAGFTERRSFSFDGLSDYTPFINALADVSLFGEKQLIELRLLKGNPGSRTGPKALQAALDATGDTNLVMICSPAVDRQQQQKAWYQNLCRKANVVVANEISREQLPGWIRDRLQAQGQEPDEDVVAFIANRTEGNLFACEQEIRKLALLAPQGRLEMSAVKDAIADVSRYDPEDLSMAILNGDAEKISKMLDGLKAENSSIPSFLWLLIEDLRASIKIKTGSFRGGRGFLFGYTTASPAKRAAIDGFARRVPLPRIELMLMRYANADKISKGLKIKTASEDPWLELKAAAMMAAVR